MAIYEYKTHIRYNDINEENKLSDKGILHILSEAAGAHSRVVGYSVNEVEETGYSWVLLFWKVKMIKRPKWNTLLTIKTWARRFLKVSSWRDFEVYDEENELVAIATTEWALIDAKQGRLSRITEKMAKEYDIVDKSVFSEEIKGKLKEEEDMEKICEYTAKRRDIDVNKHVNNVVYLEIAYDVLPEGTIKECNNLEIYYKKQIKLGDTVNCYYSKNEDIYTVCIKSSDDKILHAILKFF